jgi:hypothetical protein
MPIAVRHGRDQTGSSTQPVRTHLFDKLQVATPDVHAGAVPLQAASKHAFHFRHIVLSKLRLGVLLPILRLFDQASGSVRGDSPPNI